VNGEIIPKMKAFPGTYITNPKTADTVKSTVDMSDPSITFKSLGILCDPKTSCLKVYVLVVKCVTKASLGLTL
jgi:hypothetical protein